MENRPRGRQKNVTGAGKSIYKRGSGLGTGPVGAPGGFQNRPTGTGGGSRGSGTRASGGKSPLIAIIAAVVVLLGGGGVGLSGLLGGGQTEAAQQPAVQQTQTEYKPSSSYSQGYSSQDYSSYSSLFSGLTGGSGYSGFSGNVVSTGWDMTSNSGQLDTTVAAGARQKRTTILGNGKDTVTVMVYMCGTDLESQSGMATSDLQEMASAKLGGNVNVLVFTGGCKRWKNSVISASVNEIYKVESGGLTRLVDNAGTSAMTSPENLSYFIRWCVEHYPANRNMLIFWDHGGGSISGYGYDEKKPSSGSMTLTGIYKALSDANTVFDFIGFDACLMATAENALMLSDFADYMIASEETEPGIGWFYTNWLNVLSANPSTDTLTIGKGIADDFVSTCAKSCRGQKTTLSVVDLGELEATVPQHLKEFASATTELIEKDQYATVSDARAGSREFSPSSKIDQVDLVHLAAKLDTTESKALAKALLGAIKYNRTSSDMTNAYGLSVYFPYRKTSYVNQAISTYSEIGIDSEYSRCIRTFASYETGGQAVAGGSSPLSSLLGGSAYTSPYSSSQASGGSSVSDILSALMGGSYGESASFFGRSVNMEGAEAYLSANRFDAGKLFWSQAADGKTVLALDEEQWALVHDLELNVFYDDGEGFIDLGLDNVFDFTEYGALVGEYDGTWLAINDQPVPYYHLDTYDDGTNYSITGRVPVMLNDRRAELILVFDNEHPYGYVAGARFNYLEETETVAKNLTELQEGDTLDFLCDYYSYDGRYQNSYLMGDRMTVQGELTVSNVYIDKNAANATYRFTDIYNNDYWTPVLP